MPRNSLQKYSLYAAALILLIIILVLGYFGALSPIKSAASTIISPFTRLLDRSGNVFYSFFSSLGEIKDLRQDNQTLLQDKQQLLSKNNQLKQVAAENELLRDELQLAPRDKYTLVAAEVSSRTNAFSNQSIILNKGEKHNIKVGNPVIVSSGILIGRISEVWAHTCRATLLTDLKSEINANIQETKASGIVKGEANSTLILDLVAQTDTINPNNQVTTSDLGGDLPAGLTIGEIQSIRQSDSDIFQRATLKPAINYSEVKFTHIIIQF